MNINAIDLNFSASPFTLTKSSNLPNSSQSDSTIVSPYEYLMAQMKIQEQRNSELSVRQFVLQDKETVIPPPQQKYFVIAEQEEQQSRIQFDPCSTIQYKHASFHLHQTSDILIKEWLASPEKEKDRRTESSLLRLSLPCQGKQNKMEENYQFQKHFVFNSQQSFIMELYQNGYIKTVEAPVLRKGIRLTCRGIRR